MSESRFDHKQGQLAASRVWKKLFSPDHVIKDPNDPYKLIYTHFTEEQKNEVIIIINHSLFIFI